MIRFIFLIFLASSSFAQSLQDPRFERLITKGRGKIYLPKVSHNFGIVERGKKVSTVFKFENRGKGPLTVLGTSSPCGCFVINHNKNKMYKSGEQGEITVEFNSLNFEGSIRKKIMVMADDDVLHPRVLAIRAEVDNPLVVEPPILDFGKVKSGSSPTLKVKIKNRRLGSQFKIIEGKSLTGKLNVDFIAKDNFWEVKVTLGPEIMAGYFKDTVLVSNNTPWLNAIPIPIRADVIGNIELSPGYVEFGAIRKNSKTLRNIRISQLGSDQIIGMRTQMVVNGDVIDDTDEILVVKPSTERKGNKYNLGVVLNNRSGLTGNVFGKIFLETSNDKQKEVEIDFYGFFLDK